MIPIVHPRLTPFDAITLYEYVVEAEAYLIRSWTNCGRQGKEAAIEIKWAGLFLSPQMFLWVFLRYPDLEVTHLINQARLFLWVLALNLNMGFKEFHIWIPKWRRQLSAQRQWYLKNSTRKWVPNQLDPFHLVGSYKWLRLLLILVLRFAVCCPFQLLCGFFVFFEFFVCAMYWIGYNVLSCRRTTVWTIDNSVVDWERFCELDC